MKIGRANPEVWTACAALVFSAAAQQPAATSDPASHSMVSSGGLIRYEGPVVREIEDPHSGDRWLLVRQAEYPGGPGRLLLARWTSLDGNSPVALAVRPHVAPVIRAGDRVTVEEHTARVDAVLAAVALGSAAPGALLRVRLAVGGRVVQAIATAAGHATLALDAEGQP